MDEPWGYSIKWSWARHKKANTVWVYIYEVANIVRLIEKKTGGDKDNGPPRDWGQGNGEFLMGIEFQFAS